MKKYIKPIVEVKEFKAAERIADLGSYIDPGAYTDNGIDVGSGNITSYYAAS